MYPTIKRKCYNSEYNLCWLMDQPYPASLTHTCDDPQHSCMRNVVSFAKFPCRNQFNAVSRGIKHLITMFFPSWAIPSLAEAKPHILDGLVTLRSVNRTHVAYNVVLTLLAPRCMCMMQAKRMKLWIMLQLSETRGFC